MADIKMSELAIKFEELKKMLVHKASASLGEFGLKLFLAMLDGYQEELLRSLDACDKAVFAVKDENVLLQSLIGLNDTEVRAKLTAQASEIRFLRQEVLDLRKNKKEVEEKNGMLTQEFERLKNELAISFKARGNDQQAFDKKIEELNAVLKGYDDKVKIVQSEAELKKSELDRKISNVAIEIEKESEDAVKRAVVRLNNICRDIEEGFCNI